MRRRLRDLIIVLTVIWSALISSPNLALATSIRDCSINESGPKDTSDIQSLLSTLSSAAGVSFVVEAPLPTKQVSSEDWKSLKGDVSTDLKQAVRKVADAFDYSVERRQNVFLLRKRYTDTHDIPFITLGECLASVRDIRSILSRFDPHFNTSPISNVRESPIADFVLSLPSEQAEVMKESALPVSALGEKQKSVVWQLILYFYIQYSDGDCDNLLRVLEKTAAANARLRLDQGAAPVVPFIEVSPTIKIDSQRIDLTISHLPIDIRSDQQKNEPEPDYHSEQVALSLREAANLLTRRTNGEQTSAISVEDELASKPILVIGAGKSSPGEIARAMAAVYGLGVVSRGHFLRITCPHLELPNRVEDISRSVRHTLPTPFLRAMHIDPDTGERQTDGEPARQMDPRAISNETIARNAIAVKRLATCTQSLFEKAGKAGKPGIGIANLDETARMLIVNALWWKLAARPLARIASPPPPYITSFEKVYLSGGIMGEGTSQHLLLAPLYPVDGKIPLGSPPERRKLSGGRWMTPRGFYPIGGLSILYQPHGQTSGL